MSIVDLQALPKKSLILLASARNLVTTSTKPLLAQRVFEHEHPPPTRNTNAGDDHDSDTRETSEDQHGRNTQQTDQQTTNSAFSDDQLNQLRSLIAEAVILQQPPFVPPTVPLLSPVSDHLPSGGQDETPLANIQDDGTGERGGDSRLEPSLPCVPQTLPANLPALEHSLHDPSLPPMPEKLRTKIVKREYVDFNDLLLDNMYPLPCLVSPKLHSGLQPPGFNIFDLCPVPEKETPH